MAQQEPRSDKATAPNIIGTQFAEMGTRVQAMINLQKELFATFEQINQNWFDRAKSEMRLASELSAKLTAAHSFPDATAAYQEWLNQRMQMLADDGRHFFADSQKLIKTGVRALANGQLGAAVT